MACTSAFSPATAHCGTDVWGYEPGGPPDDAAQALDQVNCYRALLGLDPGVLHPQLDAAATAHAAYMDGQQVLAHEEDAQNEGFTGERVWDRIEKAGYDAGDQHVTELVAVGPGPRGAIDLWMNSVYHREVLTMPTWDAMGFGSSGAYTALAAVYPDPEGVVLYPADRQDDVPTRFDTDLESPDPLPDHGVVGSPLTVTGASVAAATLTGPEGEVELLFIRPGADDDLDFMTAMLPVEPLSGSTEYTLVVELGNGQNHTLTFRTGV
jgi:uncharacterized protein YkwD